MLLIFFLDQKLDVKFQRRFLGGCVVEVFTARQFTYCQQVGCNLVAQMFSCSYLNLRGLA